MNITKNIKEKIGKDLYKRKNHPIQIIKTKIFEYLTPYLKFEGFSPYVHVKDNFDILRVPKDHPSRGETDTYYKDESTVLRTHTTCHLAPLVRNGKRSFLVCGDVYRKDTIDATHFPVFHQIDGFSLVPKSKEPIDELKKVLSGLIEHLFPGKEYRFKEDSFPFTEPSIEAEVKFAGQWLEILGGGEVHREIMENLNISEHRAYAFGLGLERLAMILFNIPDIRLFWSDDERFLSQFEDGEINEFVSYSKYPPIIRDISMWIPGGFHENNLMEIVRSETGELVESVEEIDKFTHPKTGRNSVAYKIIYRSNDKTMTDGEVNEVHGSVENKLESMLNVEIR